MGTWTRTVGTSCLAGAFLLVAIAVLEKAANLAGYTFVGAASSPGRLLEFSAIAVLFAIAMELRERRPRPAG